MYGQAVIPDDFDGEYCRYSVCWPKSSQWEAILRGVLVMPARGRFWDENTGSITEAQEVIRETFDNNLHLKEVIMACGDSQLSEIASALRLLAQNQCCGESVGSNGGIQIVIESPGEVLTPIYGSQPPGELPPGEVPPDYPGTLEEYDADKCRTAHSIILGTIETMRAWSYINFAQTTGLLLLCIAAVAGAIVMPPAIIPILIAAAAVTTGIANGLRGLADQIEGNIDEWVCYLYEGESVQVIIGFVSDGLDAAIALIPATGALAVALKTIALVILNSDTLNQLFSMSQGQGDAYDCSGCGAASCSDVHWELEHGTVTDGSFDECSVTLQAEAVDIGCNRVDLSIWQDDTLTTRVERELVEMNVSPDPLSAPSGSCAGVPIYRFYDSSLTLIYSGSTPPSLPITFAAVAIVSGSAGFHVDMLFTES
jgi:hypothetical protein